MNLNYLRYKIAKPFKSWKNKYLKCITKKEAKKFNLYERVAEEISEYTHEPIQIIKQKHRSGPESEKSFDIFKDQPMLTQGKVEDFYKSCSYYLYELPLWNAECNRPKYLSMICLPYLRRNQYKKVMDFGAGAGDLCIELAKNGLEVTYCDISECLFNFAKWRFARRNLDISIVDSLDNTAEKFDSIFSFDAFEHIQNLPQTLKNLASKLKEGGSLIFSGAFSGGTLHLEENEKYNEFKTLNILMNDCGLIFQDKFAQFYFYKKLMR